MDLAPALHGADAGVLEVPHQPPDDVPVRSVVGIEHHDYLPGGPFQGGVQSRRLSSFGAGAPVDDLQPGLRCRAGVQDLGRPVRGGVVDNDDLEPIGRIVERQQPVDQVLGHHLLVLAGNQD